MERIRRALALVHITGTAIEHALSVGPLYGARVYGSVGFWDGDCVSQLPYNYLVLCCCLLFVNCLYSIG